MKTDAHNQNATSNGPLLCSHDTATLTRWGKLGDIYWDLGGADTDGQTVDESADDEHGNVLRSTNQDRGEAPDHGTDLDGSLAAKDVRGESGKQSADKRCARHGCRDTTLNRSSWARAVLGVIGCGI
jgi:hypothetical protein